MEEGGGRGRLALGQESACDWGMGRGAPGLCRARWVAVRGECSRIGQKGMTTVQGCKHAECQGICIVHACMHSHTHTHTCDSAPNTFNPTPEPILAAARPLAAMR